MRPIAATTAAILLLSGAPATAQGGAGYVYTGPLNGLLPVPIPDRPNGAHRLGDRQGQRTPLAGARARSTGLFADHTADNWKALFAPKLPTIVPADQ